MVKTGCERHTNLRTAGPVCMLCLMQQRDALRDALRELLACHTEGTDFTAALLEDKGAFSAFLKRNTARTAAACDAARKALG